MSVSDYMIDKYDLYAEGTIAPVAMCCYARAHFTKEDGTLTDEGIKFLKEMSRYSYMDLTELEIVENWEAEKEVF